MDRRYSGYLDQDGANDELALYKDLVRAKTRRWAKINGITPASCELCGVSADDIRREHAETLRRFGVETQQRKRFIVAHHWKGYEYPHDVWWICYRCNGKLKGKHDGSLSKEEAVEFVRDR